jgi:hypothetical protein
MRANIKQHNIESTEAINPTITMISHEFIAVPVGGTDPVVVADDVVDEVDVLVVVDVLLDVLVVVVEEVAVVVSHSSGIPFPFESLL